MGLSEDIGADLHKSLLHYYNFLDNYISAECCYFVDNYNFLDKFVDDHYMVVDNYNQGCYISKDQIKFIEFKKGAEDNG